MIRTLPKNFRWVFFGDSITDANRLISLNPQKAMGHGYALIASDLVNNLAPEISCQPINRGISGNRLHDLILRLDKDVIDEQPDLVSILVGINDVLRAFDRDEPSPLEQFGHAYRAMITEIQGRTGAKIILMEPYLLLVHPEKQSVMVDELKAKQDLIAEIAQEFNLPFIHLQERFNTLCKYRQENFWSADGIHPTHSGHMTIALELIKILMVKEFQSSEDQMSTQATDNKTQQTESSPQGKAAGKKKKKRES